MVYISTQAKIDLDNILIGLLSWKKVELSVEYSENYIDDLVEECYRLENKSRHQNCIYKIHKRYGTKFARYQRNKNTTWYIIYNLDQHGNILITKIISNYITGKKI